MASRFSSNAVSEESAVWSPTDESIIQLVAADPGAQVEIVGRVSLAAPWVRVGTLSLTDPFLRLPKFPFLKAVIVRNTANKGIKIEDSL